jgi:hypothetical protein
VVNASSERYSMTAWGYSYKDPFDALTWEWDKESERLLQTFKHKRAVLSCKSVRKSFALSKTFPSDQVWSI